MRWPHSLLVLVLWLTVHSSTIAQTSPRADDPAATTISAVSESADGSGDLEFVGLPSVGGPDEQLGRLFDRYLWFVPQAPGHKASLGIAVFVVFALLLMFSARIANLDGVTFGRACAMSGIMIVLGCIEGVFVPALALAGVAVGLLDLVVWFVLVRTVLGGDFWNAAVMLVSFVFATLLAVLALEVGGTLLHRDELMQ